MTGPGSKKRAKSGSTAKPSAGDVPAIAAFIRNAGSVAFYTGDVPADFITWRQSIRRAAAALGIRVSVRRQGNTVWVLDPDYEPSDDVVRAAVETVGSIATDEPIDFPTALQRQRRNRLGLVQGDAQS